MTEKIIKRYLMYTNSGKPVSYKKDQLWTEWPNAKLSLEILQKAEKRMGEPCEWVFDREYKCMFA